MVRIKDADSSSLASILILGTYKMFCLHGFGGLQSKHAVERDTAPVSPLI